MTTALTPGTGETGAGAEGETPTDGAAAPTVETPTTEAIAAPPIEEAPVEAVAASAEIREELADQNATIGNLADNLDAMAIEIGSMRLSAFDVLLVIGVILFVITLAWIATKTCHAIVSRMSRLDGTQKLLTEKISTILIWAAAFLLGIDLLGINLTAFAVFSGAFGLAIGFGLQKTFGNLISGILLLLDKSIKPGDVISVSDQAGNESIGQIRKIGIRAISVITRDQTEHLIPNENLMINQVVNWSYSSRDVRVRAPVGVSYGSDLKLVSELLYQAVGETDRILKNPKPRVNIMGFGDSSVDFELRFWIQDPEGGLANIRSDVYMRIWELFQENDIEIPFPQRDLNVRSNEQIDRLISALSNKVAPKPAKK